MIRLAVYKSFFSPILVFGSEKAMALHSSTLAWKLPWTEEPGGLQSVGSLKSRARLNDFTFTFHFPALAGRFFATEPPGKLRFITEL